MPELSGTFRNLPPEPAPATRTGTHRSLSGLKTPLAYAVGEKLTSTTSNLQLQFNCVSRLQATADALFLMDTGEADVLLGPLSYCMVGLG